MGNANSVKGHIENAEKTGVCQLSAMNISEFPSQLLKLANKLRTLDISHNKLETLPETIGNFQVLKSMNLNDNRLSLLCISIAKLRKLETLTVARNRLTSLPSDLQQCAALKSVDFSENRLKGFPEQLSVLKHLNSLDLSKNSISVIPESVRSLQAIELNLNQNQLPALPDALALCPRLKVIRVEENCLPLSGISTKILTDSNISLLAHSGNLFSDKEFHDAEGYDKYMERYTATKKKFD